MPTRLTRVLAILLSIASATASAAFVSADPADADAPYTADDFVTAYWSGPPEKLTTLDRYKEIRDANFTVAFFPSSGDGPAFNRTFLDLCQQVGMKAVLRDGRIPTSIGGSEDVKRTLDAVVADYSAHPALLAYHIADEPGTNAFPGLAEVNAYLKLRDPKHPGYINLLPSHVPANMLGDTYDRYVQRFVETVKPALLSYDHYAMTVSRDRPEFFPNLAIVRAKSLAAGVPFWNIVLVTQHADYRNLTERELRYQAMQTIAFGGRGVVWFTYWSPAGFDANYQWSHAMINPDGSRDAHYEMVKSINADVLAIGRALKHAKPTAIAQLGPGANATLNTNPLPLTITTGQLTVGVFQDDSSSPATHFAVLANRDYKSPTTAKFRFPPSPAIKSAAKFDPAKKTWTAVDPAAEIQLEIRAGDAAVVRW